MPELYIEKKNQVDATSVDVVVMKRSLNNLQYKKDKKYLFSKEPLLDTYISCKLM